MSSNANAMILTDIYYILWFYKLSDNRMLMMEQRSALKRLPLLLLYRKLKHRHRGDDLITILLWVEKTWKKSLHGNHTHCQEILRMDKNAFKALSAHFRRKRWRRNSRYFTSWRKDGYVSSHVETWHAAVGSQAKIQSLVAGNRLLLPWSIATDVKLLTRMTIPPSYNQHLSAI